MNPNQNQNDSDFIPFCKMLEMKSTITLYDVNSYSEKGIYTVYLTGLQQYFTVLFTGSQVSWLHTSHMGSPTHIAFDKHRSFVQQMNEAEPFEISPDPSIGFPLKESDVM